MSFDEIKAFIESGNYSIDQITELSRAAGKARRNHGDYEARQPAAHTVAKKDAVKAILQEIMGFNKALTTAKRLIKDGVIDLRKLVNTNKYEVADFSDTQVRWAAKSVKQVKVFMPKKVAEQQFFTPQNILDALVSAGTLTGTAFTNRQKAYQHDAEKRKTAKTAKVTPKATAKAA